LPKCNSNHETGVPKSFPAMAVGRCKVPIADVALLLTKNEDHALSQLGHSRRISACMERRLSKQLRTMPEGSPLHVNWCHASARRRAELGNDDFLRIKIFQTSLPLRVQPRRLKRARGKRRWNQIDTLPK
jgi:hypothetical protein